VARVVGLDVGARHVRLVEADGSARGLRVLRLGEREVGPVPEGGTREDAVRDAVEALFRDTRASRGDVVLSWPAESAILRELAVPFREDDQIRKVVKFEIESHLHSQSVEDVVVDYVRTGETKDGARILAVAVPKVPLQARLTALDKVKVDPVAVDLDVAALFEAAFACGALEECPNGVLIDIGTRATKIVLVVEGRWATARAVRGGVEGLATSLGEDLGVEGPAAEARAYGGGRPDDLMAVPAVATAEAPPAEQSATSLEGALVADRRSDFLDRLAREVTRTMASAGPSVTLAGVLLTGRGSLVPGVRERLAERLGLPVKPLDLLGKVAHPVPAERAEETAAIYAVALGAAARGLGGAPLALDLRREGLAFARRFDQVKGWIAVALVLLLAGEGLLLDRARREKEAGEAEFGRMVAELNRVSKAVEGDEASKKGYAGILGKAEAARLPKGSGDPLEAVADALARARYMKRHLSEELGLSTDVPSIRSCLQTWLDVHGRVTRGREKLDYFRIESEDYQQDKVTLQVVLGVRSHVDALKDIFNAEPKAFASVEDQGSGSQRPDGRWAFTIVLGLPKPEKPK